MSYMNGPLSQVVVLTDVVAKICGGLDIGALVDLGSGKGYLSQVGCEAIKSRGTLSYFKHPKI